MCGIHGIFNLDGTRVSPDTLLAMGQVTRHRGPDDSGVHIDGACGIGMQRLSIIDLAGGHQPLSNGDDTTWLVCNGEIYNYRELRAELRSSGVTFKTGSDCEVMLHLYDRHGDAFVEHLNGMFDFALWDARRRRLVIGRDHLGVKPLYVYQDGRRLAFATEAKALLTLAGVSPELETAALGDYLELGYTPAPQTLFRGIRKLPPATLLAIENGKVSQRRYWRIGGQVDRSVSEREWVERIRSQVEESVRRQMVSDVPIGAFLSGGVDSSAVVAFMARHSAEPISTYAIGFDGGHAEKLYNELPWARQVAERFGTRHREIIVRPDVAELLPSLVWHLDEPVADTAFITTFLVSRFAREDVKVILSGVGGDELFAGYRRYLGAHYAARYNRLPVPLRRVAAVMAGRLPSDRHSGVLNRLRLARAFIQSASEPPDERYRSYVRILDPDTRKALLPGAESGGDALSRAFAAAGSDDELNRLLAVDAETQLPDDLLLLTDKMSMAVSLECRVPLLDKDLVQLGAAIPMAHKVPGGRLKHLLKEAVADLLPPGIIDRPKRGFGTPMGAWLKQGLLPLMSELLGPEAVSKRGILHYPAVEQLMGAHLANRIDGTDALLALINLEVWSRVFLDRRSPADVSDQLKACLR